MENQKNIVGASSRLNRVLGIFILCLGLVLIGFAMISSYNIFTKKTEPPDIFGVLEYSQEKELDPSQNPKEESADFIESSIKEQIGMFLPLNYISHFFNLASWSILAWILTVGGFHVANIGINLIKN